MEIDEIRKIKAKVELELLNRPGVTGVDIGNKTIKGRETDRLAIIVYVEKKGPVDSENQIPEIIEGVPTDVVERKFILH